MVEATGSWQVQRRDDCILDEEDEGRKRLKSRGVNDMSKIKLMEIQCLHCRKWFPSPIAFSDMDHLLSQRTHIEDNKASCFFCQRMTPCNRENMRVISAKEKFRGLDTR